MIVCSFLESKDVLAKTGIMSAYRNHKRALEKGGITYTDDPTEDFDVLHLHWIGPKSYYHFRQAKKQGKPVVITAHSTAETSKGSVTFSELINPLVKSYMRHLYDNVDLMIAPSPYTKTLLRETGVQSRIEVVSNGIDENRFGVENIEPGQFRKEHGLERFTILSVGQVIPRKGVNDFLEVAKALPQFDFVWLGERLSQWLTFYPQMHRAIENAPDNVKFLGFVDKVEAAYQDVDVFFFPTYEENQPMTILESVAMGLPMVLRDIRAFSDWLIEDVHCLKGSTNEDFIAQIEAMANDGAMRERHSNNLLDMASSHYLTNVGQQYQTVYNALLEGNKAYV
jgi:1,2-diacylglycerol-3-alpha-glucose alpha-1,2-glucosyltransferase